MDQLQLKLGFSTNNEEFDLNSNGFGPIEGETASGLSSHLGPCFSSTESTNTSDNCYLNNSNKRRFEEVQTLPLLMSWNRSEEDESNEHDKNSSTTNNEDDNDDEAIVGWPPISTWRKKFCRENICNSLTRNNICDSDDYYSVASGSKSTYVKVKMEGMAIARKVDLSLHHSCHTLTYTLLEMFGKGEEYMNHYRLTYQDIDGNWLLAHDVSWSTFIQSAYRLKLVWH